MLDRRKLIHVFICIHRYTGAMYKLSELNVIVRVLFSDRLVDGFYEWMRYVKAYVEFYIYMLR